MCRSLRTESHRQAVCRDLLKMEQEKQSNPVSVVALRAESRSVDGKNIVISLRTKYSTAERKYVVPLECFQDFIVDLQRLTTL